MAGAAKAESGAPSQSGSPEDDGFAEACERTRQALQGLAERWRDVAHPDDSGGAEAGVAGAAACAAEDPAELAREGFVWGQEVGLAYVVPRGALQFGCRATARSLDRDGLHASTAGGPGPCTHPDLVVAPAPPCGYGVFATKALAKGQSLGEYTGEVRRYDVWVKEIADRKLAARGTSSSVPFIPEELYAAWTGSGPSGAGVVVDAFASGNAMRFINCSCAPNCVFKAFGEGGENHHRLNVVTLRRIKPWEQLSVDYGWYFDDATLADVRAQAVESYSEDRAAISSLAASVEEEPPDHDFAACSQAVKVLAGLRQEARGSGAGPSEAALAPRVSFLQRFVDPKAFLKLLDGCGGQLPKASGIKDIPEALWPLYEVVGAERVGIPCRCALEPSLNSGGRCSGIIGRPLQATLSGLDDVTSATVAPEWL